MLVNFRRNLANLLCPELEIERRAAERAANVDPLTGLANRRAWDLAAATAFCKCAIADCENVVILFDANNFGKINKVKGHDTGDFFLKTIGRCIRDAAETFGLGERVFRLGGDEFVVIAPRGIAGLIRDIAELSFGSHPIDDFVVSVSGTIGETIEQADAVLQARKQNKKKGDI